MKHSWKMLSTRSAALVLGASLMLPGLTAHAATTYTAKDSDTFWKLSSQLGIPMQLLMNANPNVDPLNIYAGLKLAIPDDTSSTKEPVKESVTKKPVKKSSAKEPAKAPAKENVQAAKPVQALTTANGQSLAFSKVLNIKATAYSASTEENGQWGAVDYFGNPLKLGTIAVDPAVIPFGTKVYITGYDFTGLPTGGMVATATDAGGAIKGNRIDIFVPGSRDFVSDFGYQNIKVYFLK
ncbi:3D domain-containing protein [Cohnella sp. WQ 127256]|uniref:3D domain-containing protein n=1 Tax=Cohnella sp. WQ 127256 TaxID=2938790 RepID=UPI00211965A7|nr:3D domain-containing protein [Cohnella sp. WQ 127256]